MTMLCAVEGVTRAGVVDAAGVAWKSASEMGHSVNILFIWMDTGYRRYVCLVNDKIM